MKDCCREIRKRAVEWDMKMVAVRDKRIAELERELQDWKQWAEYVLTHHPDIQADSE